MSDNITANAGSGGATFASDDIGGIQYPRAKVVWGPDGTANDTDVASGKPLPVQLRVADGTAIAFGTGAASSGTQRVVHAADDPATASLGVIDDWDESDRCKVNLIVGQAGLAAGAGAVAATVPRMTLASDDPAVTQLRATARLFAVAASALTRPANQDAYTANDAVSNNATAGSVTATSFSLSDTNDDTIALERMRLASTDTAPGVAGTSFRAWLYRSDPTSSTGVVGGDNAAFSTKQGTFIGCMEGAFRAFSDGSVAVLTPAEGARILTSPTSGAKTLFALFQTLGAFTPSANSTIFTATLEGRQGRA